MRQFLRKFLRRKWVIPLFKNAARKKVYVHPGERISAGVFLLGPLSALLATFYPRYRGLQDVVTICVAFICPFLLIYSAWRSRPHRTGNALATSFCAMGLLIFSYSDIYMVSGLVIDMTVKPEPLPISKWSDAVYFSVVTWTTLGYGDLQPQGSCRLIAASEALVGNIFLGTIIALAFTFMGETKDGGNIIPKHKS
jgi:Ion channel